MALATRQPSAGLLHHSDRGGQYAAGAYQQLLTTYGITAARAAPAIAGTTPVSRASSNIERNSCTIGTMATRAEAKQDIFEYIEVFYNRTRRHSTLGYDSPAEYEARAAVA
ncbi:MAG: IS3 family transposase [Nitrospira sp.]|nr:IS3 family transposase [Nitrospira sp.]